jgi:hypothetical protein
MTVANAVKGIVKVARPHPAIRHRGHRQVDVRSERAEADLHRARERRHGAHRHRALPVARVVGRRHRCDRRADHDEHDYQTLVVDTLDAAEAMLWRFICERDKKQGSRTTATARDTWRRSTSGACSWRGSRSCAASVRWGSSSSLTRWIKPFKNPEGDDFDRYEMKLHPRAGGMLREWCDAVLFANYEVLTVKETEKSKAKGVTTDKRIMHTRRTAAFDAKNRYGLPDTLDLDYAAFVEAVKAGEPDDAAAVTERINQALAQLGDSELASKVAAAITGAGGDVAQLERIENRINATLRAKEGA